MLLPVASDSWTGAHACVRAAHTCALAAHACGLCLQVQRSPDFVAATSEFFGKKAGSRRVHRRLRTLEAEHAECWISRLLIAAIALVWDRVC